MQIEFLHPYNSIFIILGLLIVSLFVLGYKKKEKILRVFHLSYSKQQWLWKTMSLSIGLVCIILALMGPMIENGVKEIKGNGLEIYVLFDTSKSMLVEDVLPSRLERGKYVVSELLKSLEGDRIGFIPFASSAYIQMPLTDDYQLANMFLDVMDTDMMSGGGSNVAKAINLALDSFNTASESDQVILIISDGEENQAKAIEAVNNIKSTKTKIYTIGVGTTKGGLIPEYADDGVTKLGYKKDQDGHAIMSKLDEELLKELSSKTKGSYYPSTLTSDEVKQIVVEFNQLNKAALEVKKLKDYKQLYQYPLGFGLCFILLALFVPERRLAHV